MKKVAILVLLIAATAAACAPAAPAPSAVAPTKTPFPLVIANSGFTVAHAPVYVGIFKGFFARQGFDVKAFNNAASGFIALSALQTGDAQIADAAITVAAQAAQKGVQVKGVTMGNGDPTGKTDTIRYFAIVGGPNSGIREGHIEDLKGKKVGVPTGTMMHEYLYYSLQKAATQFGLNPDKDVTLVNINQPDLPAALQSGSIDAMVAAEPNSLRALAVVKGSITVLRGGGAMQYLFVRWMSPKFIQEHRPEAKAFLVGFLEGMRFARENPDEATSILATVYFQGVDPQIIKQSLQLANLDPRVSKVTLQGWEQDVAFAKAIGNLPQDFQFNFQDYFDVSLLNEVLTERPDLISGLPPIPADLQLK